jgi:hypothetical protein
LLTDKSSRPKSLPRRVDRNKYHTKADWQFTTDDARIKLKHLYPTF